MTSLKLLLWFFLTFFLVLTLTDDLEVQDEEECDACSATSSRTNAKPKQKQKENENNDEPKMSPEEMQQMYEQFLKQQQAQQQQQTKSKEEIEAEQQERRDNLPHFNFPDTAYKTLQDIKDIQFPKNTWGCGYAFVPSGSFYMGSEDDENYREDGEAPIRKVRISNGFYMDRCEVTNGQFFEYWVREKQQGKTEAERYGWTFVFVLLISEEVEKQIESAVQSAPWWLPVSGADFRRPYGPDSDFNNRLNHPVVHIGWTDATKYCKWRGGRLPTEAEWEYSARGKLHQMKFPWGNEMNPNLTKDGTYSINIFTGEPYASDNGSDGFNATAPVGSFWPNKFGLYDMVGNVWEWVSDFWTPKPQLPPNGKRLRNPKGPKYGRDHVMKGGSYMCHQETCRRYRVSGRSHAEPDSSTGNLGFRCVYDEFPTHKFTYQTEDQNGDISEKTEL